MRWWSIAAVVQSHGKPHGKMLKDDSPWQRRTSSMNHSSTGIFRNGDIGRLRTRDWPGREVIQDGATSLYDTGPNALKAASKNCYAMVYFDIGSCTYVDCDQGAPMTTWKLSDASNREVHRPPERGE
nr:hypothetical protein CFP56_30105 [Quercus suber]